LSELFDPLYDPLVGDGVDVHRWIKQSQRGIEVPQRFLVPELAFESN
jgi:hypothetical protein